MGVTLFDTLEVPKHHSRDSGFTHDSYKIAEVVCTDPHRCNESPVFLVDLPGSGNGMEAKGTGNLLWGTYSDKGLRDGREIGQVNVFLRACKETCSGYVLKFWRTKEVHVVLTVNGRPGNSKPLKQEKLMIVKLTTSNVQEEYSSPG